MGRLIRCALRRYSSLGPTAIARRYSRTPAAVTVATKEIEAEGGRGRRLAASLLRLKTEIGRITQVKY